MIFVIVVFLFKALSLIANIINRFSYFSIFEDMLKKISCQEDILY
jgi:hypothetical protein